MILILPLLFPLLLGGFSAAWIVHGTALHQKRLLIGALAFPLGFGICSLLLFWAYVLNAASAKMIMVTAASVLVLILIYADFKTGAFQTLLAPFSLPSFKPFGARQGLSVFCALLFLCSLYQFGTYHLGKNIWNIWGGWDAQFFWNLKAKFFFRDPLQWHNMFSPLLDWSHPDYPLLLPGTLAWGWHMAGREFLLWAPAVDFLFFFSLCLFVVWYLSTVAGWPEAFLAGALLLNHHVYRFWATTQYADIPVCFFITVASVFLVLALRTPKRRLFFFSGLLAGMAAWTKNEGLFFLGWLAAVFTGVTFLNSSVETKNRGPHLLAFALGLLGALSAVLYSKMFLGLEGGEYLGSGRSAGDYLSLLLANPSRTQVIGAGFLSFTLNYEQWRGLWILFLAALIFFGRGSFKNHTWILAALVLLIEAGYALVLHWSPSDIYWQISVSLSRLMMHAGVLALIFAFESAGRFSLKDETSRP